MFAEDNGVDAQRIAAHSKLCSSHFVPGRDYTAAAYPRRLINGAVPSVVSTFHNIKPLTRCVEQIVCTYRTAFAHLVITIITLLYEFLFSHIAFTNKVQSL